MWPDESVRGAAVEIATPSWAGRIPGVEMAGFRGRADGVEELRVIPYPAVTIFLDFRGGLVHEVDGARRQGSFVAGVAPGGGRMRGGAEVDCLQIRLSPVVAHAVLGRELGGEVAGFEEVWGRDAERIRERVRAAASWDERFAVAERVIARRCAAGRAVDPEVAFAWERIVASRGQARVERLAEAVGWSRQRLWSRFRGQTGLTPKRAATLVRFDHAAHRLAAGHSAAAVASECGFVDQSHLCRDAMALAAMTPTDVAAAIWLTVDDAAWPARV
ncbi:helix-turn-helix domain-containing protein [Nocardia sp. NPDC050406]|uniref:helix-turn-helix domain-containing protein n=1 Tax=Nocardia sp. NPDC050406 TaxID=3364318 RepID=UPI00379A6171